jgi:hypothetical protein
VQRDGVALRTVWHGWHILPDIVANALPIDAALRVSDLSHDWPIGTFPIPELGIRARSGIDLKSRVARRTFRRCKLELAPRGMGGTSASIGSRSAWWTTIHSCAENAVLEEAPLSRPLRPGKLPPRLLIRLLRLRGAPDRRVVIGPRCGEDAAVIALGRLRLVLKSDPVTFTASEIGWYAVQVNANDVVVMGARPCWFQPTILLPPGTPATRAGEIVREIDAACRGLGIAVTGGHTEVTDAVTRPIVAGDMQGLLVGSRIIGAAGARPGDLVLMTKAAGLEGTAILATERPDELARHLPAPSFAPPAASVTARESRSCGKR